MRRKQSAATADEEAELRALSSRAERDRQALGDTVQALAEKAADGASVRALARRGAAYIAADAQRATATVTRKPVSAAGHALAHRSRQVHRQVQRSDYLRAAAIGAPAVLLAAFVAWQLRRYPRRR